MIDNIHNPAEIIFKFKKDIIISSHQEEQPHYKSGQYIKSAVYGGLDGIITILSIAYSGALTSINSQVIIAIAISALVSNATSMAVADYLASKSDEEYMKTQEQRERLEIQNQFQIEKQQMKDIYIKMGLQAEVSRQLVQIFSQNKQSFLRIMMMTQLNLMSESQNPIGNSLVSFFSFNIFGFLPLIPLLIASHFKEVITYKHLIISIFIGVAEFIIFGIAQGILTNKKWYLKTLQTLLIAGFSIGAAIAIGFAFQNFNESI